MKNVVFCIPGKTFSNKFVLSWSNLLNSTVPVFKVIPLIRMAYANNIYIVRDLCLGGDKNGPANQKPLGNLDYDYIMWIDSDSIFTPEQFKLLLDRMEKNKDIHILSGIYLLEDGRYSAYLKDGRYLMPKDIEKIGNKPLKVLYSGMGFMLVRKGVFEKIPYPWFSPFRYTNPQGAQLLAGDDASFCKNAKDAGFDTWIDPKVIIGHEKMQQLK